jgi:Cyclic nucleotide-binding domain
MNGSRTFPGPSNALPGEADSADRGAARAALAVSMSLRNFKIELNIGRNGIEGPRHLGVRDSVLRHLRFTDDDREQARESRFRERRAKRASGDRRTPPLATPTLGNGSGRCPEPPLGAATPPNFWTALSSAQQEEFRMLADERTFAAGARLMREGETADYVIVILDGRTRISVRGSNGIERVAAHRGPGQLVGERAALRVNVRSATVITLDQVQALAMTTANFATFLTAHPDVLQLVEEQVYERLTKIPEKDPTVNAQSVSVERTALTEYGEGALHQFAKAAVVQLPQWDGQNCTTIFSDVVAFGSTARSDDHRRIIRREVLEMTRASLHAIWDQCHHVDRGDGLLVVAPPSIPTVQILEYLLIALPIALKRHNRIYAEGAQIQLRVALDVGPVSTDELGVSGQVIINAARQLDAPAFKDAMGVKHAPLGMIVSDFVYQSAVSQAGSLADPASYEQIDVKVKQTRLRAWTLLVESPVDASRRMALATVA